ncbi:molybdenum cofactor biosynthesis protein A [Saprolegnia parasitica CBS 223.65]|uniref:GTP 3',8-cyclase n=1 Tax=Saprolegnia parasitica (strain CBS 223.65) TaxID=695850 RepID=A0A067CLK9_SAPPC|nr:molybdenum cofactor biosynthesis protein A [Saprolegnia parasitica CBS 223.65]KDO27441.1 molybdenum cofactor biosynthesis protein A [Saprolegnia parasitica CBS 223.65]|eukprot:XP_012201880.1 molybdenum cofactor biosynthesis protein A [Saprolegnia parasitica CBS 223.65]
MAARMLRRALSTVTPRRSRLKAGPSLADFVRSSGEPAAPSTEDNVAAMRALVAQLQAAEKEDNLVDTFGRVHTYLRISLTERCNLRCQYCMPADGVPLQPADNMLTTDEIVRLASLFAAHGVTKLRLTGGEPLLRKDIVPLTQALHAIPGIESVGVTTNGIALPKHSSALTALNTRLNISLDTLDARKFEHITRRKGFSRVMAAIEVAAATSSVPVKLNCVVMRDFNLSEVADFVALTIDKPIDVRFIEWMPFDSNKWSDSTFVPYREMLARIEEAFPLRTRKLADDDHDTAKAYAIDGARGRFGFITSMSEHFCGGCNRLRLTADGNLKVCLFGHTEVSLRDALRAGFSDDELRLIVQAAVKRKKFALGGHGDMYGIASAKNRPMILIGG